MKRTIFLVDMNAFFISCEMTRQPALRDGPAAVAGDPARRAGIILAANYTAREFGVRTAMTVPAALRLCPTLQLTAPDHSFYAEKSQEVMAILSRYSPVVEQNSIDEAWLDMTGTEGLFGTPQDAARSIMDEIENQLGLWCSIGIADNKFLAKMASELKKPRGISELYQAQVEMILWPLPVRAMNGVGAQTASKLERLGIRTIGELARLDPAFLAATFGKTGDEIHRHANGIDHSPVHDRSQDDAKSIGRSTTLATDLTDVKAARRIILDLTEDVGRRARKQGLRGHTVQITLKYADFQSVTRQITLPATFQTQEIYQAGCNLLDQNWDAHKPVRLLGISLSGFEKDDLGTQLTLFDLQSSAAAQPVRVNRDIDRLDQAIDEISRKFGSGKITRAALIRPVDDGSVKTGKPGKSGQTARETEPVNNESI